MTHQARVVALAIMLAACGSNSEEHAPTEPVATTDRAEAPTGAASETPHAVETPELPPAAPEATRAPRMDVASRRQMTEFVVEARRSARGRRWSEALASFQRALALDPSNARLRCETGYAAYRAGEIDQADQLIADAQRALSDPDRTPGPLRVATAMCLYNASLVHEARGRLDDARSALEASLALRPNATVETALAGLGGAEVPAPAVVVLDGLDDAAIDARVWALQCESAELEVCEPADPESDEDYEVWVARRVLEPVPTESAPFAARIIVMSSADPGAGSRGSNERREWLVVRDGAHALAGAVRVDHMTETVECGDVDTRLEWVDLVPGGAPELLVDARSCSVDVSGCGDGGADERVIMVCAASPLRCVSVPVQRDSYYSEYEGCDISSGEVISDAYDGYRMDVEIGASGLTLRPSRGTPPVRVPIGTTPFTTLLAREDLRWGAPD